MKNDDVLNITKKNFNKNMEKNSYTNNSNSNNTNNPNLIINNITYNNNNLQKNISNGNLTNRDFNFIDIINIIKNLQNSGYINPNFVNLGNIEIFNSINNLLLKLEKIKKELSNFRKLKDVGLQSLEKPTNINHYLLNGNNNIININLNNPNINVLQLNKNANNSDDQNNYQIIFKRKSDIPSYEKIQKINITTKYHKNNSNVNKEMKIAENNKIIIEDIISGKEKRTVVRLSPIPPNFSSFDVSKFLDKYLKIESNKNQRIYKALFAPLSKVIGKNIGYCFVMMVKPEYVIDFYNTFNGITFKKKKCKKPCTVVWANLQGNAFLNVSNDPLRSPIIFKDIRND